ncbi:GAF domain-containing protein, partial [Roseisolibacter sp. H3M3-2]|uniref:GAF domain-containing protein n=1 Tax=Roseisolibacter sp. H3M3-2 TaxID=3031323 RepID=UPI0023DA2C7E
MPVVGDWWDRRLHPDDLAGPVARMRAAYDDAAVDRVAAEYRVRHRDGSWRWLADRARVVRDADGRPASVVGIVADVTLERAARDRARALHRVTAALAATRDTAAVARAIAEHAAAALDARSAEVWVGDADALECMARVGPSVAATVASDALAERARRGEARFVAGDAPWAALPLRAGGPLLAAFALAFVGVREFSEGDRAFLALLAQQCAQALDRTRAYDVEREAADRAGRLQELTARLNRATSRADIADAVFEGALAAVGADGGSLAIVRADGDDRPAYFDTLRAAGFDERERDRYRHFPVAPGRPLSDAVLTGAPVFLGSPDAWRAAYPDVAEELTPLGYRAFVAVPVVAGGRTLAALSLGFAAPRAFDDATRTFLDTVAEQCALALERQRLHEAELGHAARQAALLATIQDPFTAFDRELRCTYVNAGAEALLQRPAAALLGRRLDEVVRGAARSPLLPAIVRALASGEAAEVEAFSPAPGRWVEARAHPSPDGVSLVFHDVTARRRAQDGAAFLAEASRLLGESLDAESSLGAVALAAVPRLADWCAVDLVVAPEEGAWPPALRRAAR